MLVSTATVTSTVFPQVSILYSPVIEMVASLYALCSQEEHSLQDWWMQRALEKMDAEFQSEMQALARLTERWTLVMDLSSYVEQDNAGSVSDFLAYLGGMELEDFAYGLLSGVVSRKKLSAFIKSESAFERWKGGRAIRVFDKGFLKSVLADVEGLRSRLLAFLARYWAEVYADIWKEIGALEINQVNVERTLLHTMGVERYLSSSHKDLEVTSDALVVTGDAAQSYSLADIDRIEVAVSTHVLPHLMISNMDGKLTLYRGIDLYNVRHEFATREVLAFIKAIGSETKLAILRELYEGPKTTKELSDLVGIAPSSVTEHLKLMRDAELVHPQRVKNAVYNSFLHENYQALAKCLVEFFDR